MTAEERVQELVDTMTTVNLATSPAIETTPAEEPGSVRTMHDRAMAHVDAGELLQAFHWEAMAAVGAGDLGLSDATQVILMRSAGNLARTIVDDLLKYAPATDAPRDITIHLDARPLSVLAFYRSKGFAELPETATMSGGDIKLFGRADVTYWLELEIGPDERRQISDGEPVILKDGMRFYAIPPATY